jgi:hypothetical protein
MLSWFQTYSGEWHWPSIALLVGWLAAWREVGRVSVFRISARAGKAEGMAGG